MTDQAGGGTDGGRRRRTHTYADQWRLFEVRCDDFYVAARYAADRNWWLHCWTWVETGHADSQVVVVGEPDPPLDPAAPLPVWRP